MADLDKALATQLANIEKRSGKTIAELVALARGSGLTKFGEVREMLKRDLGMGHGDANVIATKALGGSTLASSPEAALDGIYNGPKAALRPIHDELMKQIRRFGEFEIAPKKAYVSLRRRKQFAMIGPATKTEVEVGLNAAKLPASRKITKLPPGGMCSYKCRITSGAEIDKALLTALRQAYDEAG
jgi:Domain of unknown function (DUF5655)/Domain of unknown function (DUF4287)